MAWKERWIVTLFDGVSYCAWTGYRVLCKERKEQVTSLKYPHRATEQGPRRSSLRVSRRRLLGRRASCEAFRINTPAGCLIIGSHWRRGPSCCGCSQWQPWARPCKRELELGCCRWLPSPASPSSPGSSSSYHILLRSREHDRLIFYLGTPASLHARRSLYLWRHCKTVSSPSATRLWWARPEAAVEAGKQVAMFLIRRIGNI